MRVLEKVPFVILFGLLCTSASFAQDIPVPPPPKTQAPAYNPALAKHDLDVGKFYQNRGDLDGAIARYKDALRYKPNYAEPCLLLGQVYEQKHDAASAISYYQQYLKILPDGSEAKKVRKRIAELQEKMK